MSHESSSAQRRLKGDHAVTQGKQHAKKAFSVQGKRQAKSKHVFAQCKKADTLSPNASKANTRLPNAKKAKPDKKQRGSCPRQKGTNVVVFCVLALASIENTQKQRSHCIYNISDQGNNMQQSIIVLASCIGQPQLWCFFISGVCLSP